MGLLATRLLSQKLTHGDGIRSFCFPSASFNWPVTLDERQLCQMLRNKNCEAYPWPGQRQISKKYNACKRGKWTDVLPGCLWEWIVSQVTSKRLGSLPFSSCVIALLTLLKGAFPSDRHQLLQSWYKKCETNLQGEAKSMYLQMKSLSI